MSRKLTISQTDLERNPLRASNEEITKGTIDVTSSGKNPSKPKTETDFKEHLKALEKAFGDTFDDTFGNKGGTRKRRKRKKKKRRRRKSTKKKRKRRRRKTRKKKRR